MTSVEYHNYAYHLDIMNLHDDCDVDVTAKFDTGAVVSFFTVSALYTGITNETATRLQKSLVSRPNIITASFNAASGEEMFAVKCHADDVMVGNIHFERFFYWLNPSVENKKALLGDDFIRFCDFRHKRYNDILIDDFDMDEYMRTHNEDQDDKSLSTEEISEMIFSE